ncbi:phospholipase D-like domain-containing protein [Kocuria turfanensis]|uniref:Cardiolipin synthase n=1 Tax=Kocuria turfanensis TaxID=388357 RepID=A0A512I9R0_9MICC|nr:phospholipase D-like domain-containing protein [Kocuria turfanensis]GEO94436.1 cardiolipin synthase [Kocuria turfanensis]
MDFAHLLWNTVPPWAAVAFFAVDLVIRLLALGTVPHNRRPSAAWGWLLVIFFFPILGGLVFLALGRADLPEARQRKQQEVVGRIDPGDAEDGARLLERLPDRVAETVRLNQHNGAFPVAGGHRMEVLDDYDASLAAMAAAIREARRCVHFQFYIAVADATTEPVIAALEEARARGVTVRVLVDHLGAAGYPGYRQLVRRLEDAGVDWRRMLPVRPWRGEYQRPDLRNHRKILVVDGTVAFTGSQNVIDRSYNKTRNKRQGLQWIGLTVRVQGPAVGHLDALFATDWYCETDDMVLDTDRPPAPDPAPGGGELACQVLPSGPGLGQESNLQLFNHLFATARERITVCSPYFVPEDSMYNSLRTAVGRGVEVHLYMGETSNHVLTHHAQRSFYERLIRDGIRIHLYRAPYVLHSKFVLIDELTAVVGSSNMDIRSFVLDHEVNLLVVGAEFVGRLDGVVAGYRENSHELELADWLARPWYQKYLDNTARLTSALQ